MEDYYASLLVRWGLNDWDDAAALGEIDMITPEPQGSTLEATTPEPQGALHAAIPVADTDSTEYAQGLAEAPGRWNGPGLHYYGLTRGQEVDRDHLVAVWGARHVETGEQVAGPYGQPSEPPRRPRKAYTRTGVLPDGTTKTDRRSGIVGWDYTASVPSSVSYLWALETDEVRAKIEAALAEAIEQTMTAVEREVGVSRRTRPTKHQVRAPITAWAEFLHRSNRYGAPQLHAHVVFPHRTQGEDGKFQVLDGMSVLSNARSITPRFQQHLRANLTRRLGYGWTQVDEYGFAEVAGVPEHLKERWAARSWHIHALAEVLRDQANLERARQGLPPMSRSQEARLRGAITRRRRPSKQRMRETVESLPAQTSQPVEALREPISDEVLAGMRVRLRRDENGLPVPPSVADLVAGRRPGSTQRQWWEQQALELGITRAMLRDLVAEAAREIPSPADTEVDEDAIRDEALDRASREHATISRRHLVREVARLIPSTVDARDASEIIDRITDEALASAAVVQVSWPASADVPASVGDDVAWRPAKADHVWFTTVAGLATERRIIQRAVLGLNTGRGLIDRDVLLEAMSEASTDEHGQRRALDPTQVAVLTQIASSGDAIQTVEAAGAGKAGLLRPYVAAARQQGYQVLALAPTAAAAAVLTETTGVRALVLDQALKQWQNTPAGVRTMQVGEETIRVDEQTIVILDNAGKAGRDKWDALTQATTGGRSKLLAVGDSSDLSPVRAAGGTFYSVADEVGRLEVAPTRFEEEWEHDASRRLRAGDDSVVREYVAHDRITVADTREAALDLAFAEYREARAENLDALLMAGTEEDAAALNERARAFEKERGVLTGEPVFVGGREWMVGDVLIAGRSDGTLKIGAPGRGELTGLDARIRGMRDRLRQRQAKIDRAYARVGKLRDDLLEMQNRGKSPEKQRQQIERIKVANARAKRLKASQERAIKRLDKATQRQADLRAKWNAARSVTAGQRFQIVAINTRTVTRTDEQPSTATGRVDRLREWATAPGTQTRQVIVESVVVREIGKNGLSTRGITLPRHYLANDAQYGHATTPQREIRTGAEASIVVADSSLTRERLGKALTASKRNRIIESPARGEESGHPSDPEERLTPGEMTRRIVERSEREVSPVTRMREAADRQEALRTLSQRREEVEAAIAERAPEADQTALERAQAERVRWGGVIDRKSGRGLDTAFEQEQYRKATEEVARLEAATEGLGAWAAANPSVVAYVADLKQREQARVDFIREEVVRTEPSLELVAAFGDRPTDPARLEAWRHAAGTAAIYEDRWGEKPNQEQGRERSASQERERSAVQAAKRTWTQIRTNQSIGRSMGR